MFTKSVVLVLSQLEELKPVYSNQEWLLNSSQVIYVLKSNPLKCIMKNSSKLSQVTTLDSMSEVLQLNNLKEVSSLPIAVIIQPRNVKLSMLMLLSLLIQVKSIMVTHPSLVATLLTSLVNLIKSSQNLTEEPVKSLKRTPNSSKPVTHL